MAQQASDESATSPGWLLAGVTVIAIIGLAVFGLDQRKKSSLPSKEESAYILQTVVDASAQSRLDVEVCAATLAELIEALPKDSRNGELSQQALGDRLFQLRAITLRPR